MRKLIRKWFPDPELERVKQELTHTQSACDHLKAERDSIKQMLDAMANDQRKKIDTLLQSVTERDIEIASLNESVGKEKKKVQELLHREFKLKVAINDAAQFISDEMDDNDTAEQFIALVSGWHSFSDVEKSA